MEYGLRWDEQIQHAHPESKRGYGHNSYGHPCNSFHEYSRKQDWSESCHQQIVERSENVWKYKDCRDSICQTDEMEWISIFVTMMDALNW